jgi:hypothetical protein
MSQKNNTGKTNRRTYRKPQLEQVQLVVEEAVLEACKVRDSGPSGSCTPKPQLICSKARGRS